MTTLGAGSSLLHLVDGIELLLKARLEQAHWAFLFEDVDKASALRLASGDFRSVDLDTATQRLGTVAGVAISEGELATIRELRSLRNRVRHFAVDVELDQLKSLLAKGLNFTLEFCRRNLPVCLSQSWLAELYESLSEFEGFVSERLAAIETELAEAGLTAGCPGCLQEALILTDTGPRCLFCLQQLHPEDALDAIGEGRLGDHRRCLRCGADTLTLVLFNNEDAACACTSCGEHWQWICLDCGTLFTVPEGEGRVCPACGAWA